LVITVIRQTCSHGAILPHLRKTRRHALHGHGFETPPYLRIRRLDDKNGTSFGNITNNAARSTIGFGNNTIRLVFKKEVQVLTF